MPQFLDETITYVCQITSARLLVQMIAGHDDLENLRRLKKKPQVNWIIKRNLRQESEAGWLEEAQCHGDCETPREGKDVWTGETWREREGKLYRVVFEVIERTITASRILIGGNNDATVRESPLETPEIRCPCGDRHAALRLLQASDRLRHESLSPKRRRSFA